MRAQDRARELAVTALGIGYLPLAPGTWASAAAVVAYALLLRLLGWPAAGIAVGAGAALCVLAGVALWRWAADYYGDDDPHPFVLDEVAGQWLSYLLAGPSALAIFATPPVAVLRLPWIAAMGALPFITFRVFDVWKPFPIRQVQRLPGGWGVMLDDIVAALYAAGASWVLMICLIWLVILFVRI